MFQACDVKIVKIAAHSTPISLIGNRPMKKVMVKARNTSTGIDWAMSSIGMMTDAALRLLAANVATTKVKTSETRIAANIRKVERSAYSGRRAGSSTTGLALRAVTGRFICWAP